MNPEYSGCSCERGKRFHFSGMAGFSPFHFVVVAFMKSADFKSAVNDELIFFHADQILVVEYINGSASARRRERKF